MAKPSLIASPQGILAAKQALTSAGWTQKHLSALVGCSRQPITNFFKGEAIAQPIFMQVCVFLNLDWQAVARNLDIDSVTSDQPLDDLDTIQNLRSKVYASIQERCSTMRVLDMSYPIGVDDIYTSVNVLEQITGHRRKKIDELLQEYDIEDFDRLGLGKVMELRMPGLKAVQKYQKLIILGKPGAGKTTFLKYLAIQCNQGYFAANCLPVFVTLKDFAEAVERPTLLAYISHRDINNYAPPASYLEERSAEFYQVFESGRALLLLDGLDEVRQDDQERVLREIRDFSEQFRHNQYVITCRLAAWEYTFEKFTEVEVADFDDAQIATFATKWFQNKPTTPNAFIRCLTKNDRIHQLAVSPLLLTLLCLAFEESGDFPSSRSELYKEGVDALLKKWDAKRGIQRDQIYKNLSHQRKQDLLGQIALSTFQKQEYFLKQQVVEQSIADYISRLPDANIDSEALQLDSETVLRSIVAQHGLLVERAKGIYSFSHLTFQEYFAAREIVLNTHNLEGSLQDLLSHLTERRWQEVFLLTTEMLRDASRLLMPMKQAIDNLLTTEKLQQFLRDVDLRATAPEFAFCKPAAARAFCFDIDFDIDKNRSVALLLDPKANILVCASFFTRILDDTNLADGIASAQEYDANVPTKKIASAKSANEAMWIAIQIAHESPKLKPDIRSSLDIFKQRLENQENDEEELEQIADDARDVAKARRHLIGNSKWQFSEPEKELLRQYYNANELLLRCLNSDGCLMDHQSRHRIEEMLLMPKL